MSAVVFSLGSNLGDRYGYLEQARDALSRVCDAGGLLCSTIIETAPQYVTDQPPFLNQVVVGETELTPRMLVESVKKIQTQIGRKPSYANGPREIDIDILYYADFIVNDVDLVIPHPRICERLFVLQPLCEIAPGWVCPVFKKDAATLLSELLQGRLL